MDVAEVSVGQGSAKVRNPVHVGLLDLITLGVYGVIWYYKVHCELALLGRVRGTSELGDNPRNSLLALFPGLLVIVPAVISLFNAGKRLRAAQDLVGIPETEQVQPLPVLLLMFFLPPLGSWYFQKRLNVVWNSNPTGDTT